MVRAIGITVWIDKGNVLEKPDLLVLAVTAFVALME